MRRFLMAFATALAVGGTLTAVAGAAVIPANANWGIVNRNTIGSGTAHLRTGPATPTSPVPFGAGSVNLTVPTSADKVVWGNEVDFAGVPLSGVTSLGFSVFQTGENAAVNPLNLPNVAVEVDRNGGTLQAGDYSTLNGVVSDPAPANQWSSITHAQFWLTGAVGTATGCNQVTYCTLAQVKTALPDATILTVGINKGRDYAWQGAVDGFALNGDVYDFEMPTSVQVQQVPGQTIVQRIATPAPVVVGAQGLPRACRGNTARTIRAPKRKGEPFLSVRATLDGKRLSTSGRSITVDLTRGTAGDYRVRLTARYRKPSGKTRTVRSTRTLEVTCR